MPQRGLAIVPGAYLAKDVKRFFIYGGNAKSEVFFSVGTEESAVKAANLGAGVPVFVQVLTGFDAKYAERKLDPKGWAEFITDADGCLPIGWHGGPLKKHEQRRQDDLEAEERTARDRDIEAQVNAFRANLKASNPNKKG